MSSLSHSFCVEHAEAYGIECAILINHFQFWIGQNRAMGRNNYDGRTWMYQTQKEIASIYPYWSEDVVYKIIKKLVDLNILIKGNYNKTPFDRTIWYAFQNEKMFTKPPNDGISSNKRRNTKRPATEPIPDTKQDTKQIQQQASPVSAAAAAAVSFDSSKKEQQKPKIWPILENIDMQHSLKISITIKFPEEKVNEAIKILKSKSQQPRSIAAFIQWACANDIKYEKPEKKLTAYEKVCKIFKNGEKYNNAECYLNQQVIAFERGMKNEDVKLDKYFTWEKLEELCSIFQIQIQRLA